MTYNKARARGPEGLFIQILLSLMQLNLMDDQIPLQNNTL